ncbi:MAG: L,D-transpeptidase [Bacteroidales bacterium]
MEEDPQTFVPPDDEMVEKPDQKSITEKRIKSLIRRAVVPSVSALSVLFLLSLILYIVPVLQELATPHGSRTIASQEIIEESEYKRQINLLKAEIQNLSRRFNSFTSGQSYLVINTTDNRFLLYRNKKLIREGFCSSGSYTVLQAEGEKKWIFKTPKGKYRILGKTVSPVWRKPDWAFVEEGLPIPPANHPSRWEYGVLGDYALSIGDGYLIHGTIYKRFLGMPVTHGCIRLNDEDLESIYNYLNIGSKVYIF